ncbi:MAG: hypothetical protein SXG53_13720 [Pseudomonadota bacterium]|nr:hypothetical protein [Pseudomonadota bacterium]
MATDLRLLQASAMDKFAQHGLKTRDYFLNIKNSNPTANVLSTRDYFESQIAKVIATATASANQGSSARYEQAIAEAEGDLFQHCQLHLMACLADLATAARADYQRYKQICLRRPQYHLGGSHSAPASIKADIDTACDGLKNSLGLSFLQIQNTAAGWEQHFKKYYAAIDAYRKVIQRMNVLIDEDTKKSIDKKGIRLRWISIGVAIGLFLAGYWLGKK